MRVKDLKVGKRYDLTFKWGYLDKLFYDGLCDSLSGRQCDCCGKSLENGHVFKETNDFVSYEDCTNGDFTNQYFIGTTCIKKLGIEQSTEK